MVCCKMIIQRAGLHVAFHQFEHSCRAYKVLCEVMTISFLAAALEKDIGGTESEAVRYGRRYWIGLTARNIGRNLGEKELRMVARLKLV